MSGYVMVPGWLLEQQPSANELLVYTTLARFGRFDTATGVYEESRPALSTVVEKSGLSLSPVKRAITDLIERGALERTQRWAEDGKTQLPSVYRVIFGSLVGPGGSPGGRGGSPLPDPGGSPQGGQNPEPIHPEPDTQREDHSEADASAPAVGSENAGTIVAAWIDWLKPRNVIMPRNLIGRLAKEIKGCLDSGIDPVTVKHGLALMYERGKAHSPSLVPSFVAEVQMARSGAGRPTPGGNRHAKPLHQKQDERREAIKVAGEYLDAQGVDTESREGGKLVMALVEEILARPDGLASMNGVDTRLAETYIQGEVINPQRAIGGAAQ